MTPTRSVFRAMVSLRTIWTAPKHPRQGLRLRTKHDLNAKARYVRLGNGKGDKAYSVTEFQAFVSHRSSGPQHRHRQSSQVQKNQCQGCSQAPYGCQEDYRCGPGADRFLGLLYRRRRPEVDQFGWWIATSGVILSIFMMVATWHEFKNFTRLPMKVACVFFGLTTIWFVYLMWQRLFKTKVWSRRIETWALVVLAFTGGSNFLSYGTFHGSRAIHYWDSFHYYVGAKYFDENQYTELYNCSVIAELDDGRKSEFSTRQVRNLMTNKLGKAEDVAKNALKTCRELFADKARWNAFRNDLRLFRSHMGKDWWHKMFKDHGFNASPVWSMVGVPIANNLLVVEPPPENLVNSPANLKGKTSKQRKAINKRFQDDKAWRRPSDGSRCLTPAATLAFSDLVGLWSMGARTILIFRVGYPWAYFWTA